MLYIHFNFVSFLLVNLVRYVLKYFQRFAVDILCFLCNFSILCFWLLELSSSLNFHFFKCVCQNTTLVLSHKCVVFSSSLIINISEYSAISILIILCHHLLRWSICLKECVLSDSWGQVLNITRLNFIFLNSKWFSFLSISFSEKCVKSQWL